MGSRTDLTTLPSIYDFCCTYYTQMKPPFRKLTFGNGTFQNQRYAVPIRISMLQAFESQISSKYTVFWSLFTQFLPFSLKKVLL